MATDEIATANRQVNLLHIYYFLFSEVLSAPSLFRIPQRNQPEESAFVTSNCSSFSSRYMDSLHDFERRWGSGKRKLADLRPVDNARIRGILYSRMQFSGDVVTDLGSVVDWTKIDLK